MDKLRPRQEKFCQFYFIYACAAAAAREAGYKASAAARQGYRLLQIPRIRQRIVEIQAGMAEDRCRQIDVLLGKLEAVYLRALKDHRFYAAARAVELQARISGLATMQRGLAAAEAEAAHAPPLEAPPLQGQPAPLAPLAPITSRPPRAPRRQDGAFRPPAAAH